MQNYLPGASVKVTFELQDEAGAVLVPTAMRWRVLDEAETVLQDWTAVAVPVPVEDTLSLTVLSGLNILTPPAVRGIRTVELEVTTDAGSVALSQAFQLQAASALVFAVNSFQTYAQAVLLAQDFVSTQIAGWEGETDRETRERALIQAFERIGRLHLVIEYEESQSIVRDIGTDPPRLVDLTAAQLRNVDKRLLQAVCRAQLVEASEILAGDPVSEARHNGLISMTTGESSQFFRTTKPIDWPVSPRALAFLGRWLRYSATIGRR